MTDQKPHEKQNRFSTILKNTFFILIILQFIPSLFYTFKKYIADALHPKTYVAGLRIRGPLYDSTYFIKKIFKYLEDDEIKGLIIKMNSPGGPPAAARTLFSELQKFKKTKPVVVLIEDLGASGGYYVAAAADSIIADPQSAVGSIGTRLMVGNVKHLLEEYKVEAGEIYAGKYKASLSWVKDRTAEETAYLQNFVDESYKIFTSDIAQARGLNLEEKHLWADGKIFSGPQALELKLIDKLGDFTDAKEEMKQLLLARNVEVHDEIKVVFPKTSSGLTKALFGDLEEEGAETYAEQCASFISTVYSRVHTQLANEELHHN
jgi:protease-4